MSDHPRGLPQYAAFHSSLANFGLVRSFEFLRARLLLAREFELCELEQQLLDMDDEVDANNEHGLMSWEVDEDNESSRRLSSLLAKIDVKLREYGAYNSYPLA